MTGFNNQYSCLDCEHCLETNPFGLLNKGELITLDNTRTEVSFKKGEIIYKQGTPLTHIVIIHTGLGKIYIEGTNGRNLILHYTKKHDLNGGIGVFIDQRHYSSLMAVTDCQACFIDIAAFKSVMYSNVKFMEAYLKEHSQRVLNTQRQMVILTQKNMEGRMAEAIINLSEQAFIDEPIKNISKQDLAELTAMTKESAIRVLKEFNNDKLIETVNQSISILDKNSLKDIAHYG